MKDYKVGDKVIIKPKEFFLSLERDRDGVVRTPDSLNITNEMLRYCSTEQIITYKYTNSISRYRLSCTYIYVWDSHCFVDDTTENKKLFELIDFNIEICNIKKEIL